MDRDILQRRAGQVDQSWAVPSKSGKSAAKADSQKKDAEAKKQADEEAARKRADDDRRQDLNK